jgi:hypothetical protein
VTGDSYAAQWVAGAWRKAGIGYFKSELPKSQIYLECLPLFASGLVRLPKSQRLLRELRLLERHTHRSGRDTVDHGRNGHDDHANAVCGVLRKMSNHLGYDLFNGCLDWDDKPEPINLPLATRAKPTRPSWPGARAYTPTGERQRDCTACPRAL